MKKFAEYSAQHLLPFVQPLYFIRSNNKRARIAAEKLESSFCICLLKPTPKLRSRGTCILFALNYDGGKRSECETAYRDEKQQSEYYDYVLTRILRTIS